MNSKKILLGLSFLVLSFNSYAENPCQRIIDLLDGHDNLNQLVANMEDYIESQKGCQLNLRNDLAANCPNAWVSDLQHTSFENDLAGRNLNGANFEGARFDVDAPGASLVEANLSGVDFKGGTFNGTDFSNSKMAGVSLWNAKLVGANLSGADLRGANLSGSDLRGADLTGADLRGVDLLQADLTGANLSGAKLSGAIIERAKLEDTDLRGIIGRPQFIETSYNEATNFPGLDKNYDKSGLESSEPVVSTQKSTPRRK